MEYAIVYCSTPFNTEKEIWLPQHYTIVNKMDGIYLPISESPVKANVAWAYLIQQYKTGLINKNFTVIIQADGKIYYCWYNTEGDLLPLVAMKSYGEWISMREQATITAMPNDTTIVIYYDRNWGVVSSLSILGMLISLLFTILFIPIDLEA